MSDDAISNMLTYYRNATGSVAQMAWADIRTLAAALDQQRQTNNELADQSRRLRGLAESRRLVLAHIQTYAHDCSGAGHTAKSASFALGTIVNMVQQCWDVEQA